MTRRRHKAQVESLSLLARLKQHHLYGVVVTYAVVVGFLIQLVSRAFPYFGWSSAVPTVIIVLLLGFPVVGVLAWLLIEPKGSAQPDTWQRRHWKLSAVATAIVIALVVISGFYALQFSKAHLPPLLVKTAATTKPPSTASADIAASTVTAIPAKSIAVVPFVNDSGNKDQQFFSDGLSEDLIIALSQYPGLKVIGRESSFHIRGSNLDSRAIGRQLGVAHLLEGSVSRVGDEVRIRAELVNAADGTTLWSQHYDRPYKDLFALQDEITKAVASALEAKLAGSAIGAVVQTDHPPSGSLAAYNAYLQGNFYATRFTEEGFRKGIKYYRQAIALDPHYAAAYAALAYATSYLGAAYMGGAEMQRHFAAARTAADKALKLEPNLASGYRARGLVLHFARDWTGSAQAFRRALQLAPGSPQAQSDLSNALATLGEVQQAVELQRDSLKSNPLDAHGYYRLSGMLIALDRLDEARKAIDQAIALQPTGPYYSMLAVIEVLSGHPDAALKAAKEEQNPGFKAFALAIALAAGTDKVKADAALQSLIANYGDSEAYQVAEVYAFRRQPDKAFVWLQRSLHNQVGFAALLIDPFLLRYKDDPRFVAVCRKVGLPTPSEIKQATSQATPVHEL